MHICGFLLRFLFSCVTFSIRSNKWLNPKVLLGKAIVGVFKTHIRVWKSMKLSTVFFYYHQVQPTIKVAIFTTILLLLQFLKVLAGGNFFF
jgi:hypothetical protein